MDIDGQVALVSGGASGLGEAVARHLVALGAEVAILDRDGERAARVTSEIGAFARPCDVTDADDVGDAVAAATDRFGRAPRIAVCCAGIAPAARVVGREGKLSIALFRQTIEVNLFGTYNLMSHAARAMVELAPLETGERGVIVNTASVACEDGQVGQAAYAASKGAVAAMSLPAARDLARHAVRVVAIAPGLFRTPMMEGLPEETVTEIAANIPFPPRLGEPPEFARLAADIVRNPYLNGTVIRLDGALRLPPR